MKWWVKALIISGIWIVWDITVGIIHTEIILKDTITPELDEIISEHYGKICCFGLLFIWVFSSVMLKKETMKKYLIYGTLFILWGIGIIIYGMISGLPFSLQIPGLVPGTGLIAAGILSVIKANKIKNITMGSS